MMADATTRQSVGWPLFVISLIDAHERRQRMAEQMARHGLSYEIIDAIDGRQGLPPEYEHKIDRMAARDYMCRDMTDGEFACALSHQMIYERIVHDALPGAIVLEDDAILTSSFAGFVQEKGYLIPTALFIDRFCVFAVGD